MNDIKTLARPLDDTPVNIKLKLAALWTAATLCYAYSDILGFYQPGVLARVMAGTMGPLGPVSQGVLAGVAAFMALPAVMVALSLLLKAGLNRWLNIAMGLLYTFVMVLTMFMVTWIYYFVFGIVEMTLTLGVAWLAATWPRTR